MIDKRKLIGYVNLIDSKLEGHTKRIELYCVGGTALALKERKTLSYDLDFIVSHEDFITISSITAEIEYKEKVRIDLMPEGEHVDYSLPSNFRDYAKKVGLFKNLNLYVLSDLDITLMKALAGRRKDYMDIRDLKDKIAPKDLLSRFEELRFKPGKKEELREKLNEFIRRVYES